MLIYGFIPLKIKIKGKKTRRSRKALAFIGILILLSLLIYSFFSVFRISQTEASPAWLTGWAYRKAITIDNTYVDADLSYFPLYVKISADTDIGTHALSSGYDIRFTDSDETTVLSYERLNFSISNGEASGEFFVRVPTIYGASNTTIYIYYGKSDASDVSSSENAFRTDNGWAAVWHLEETSGSAIDSTANNNDGTFYGDLPDAKSGMIGSGQDLDGDADYVSSSVPQLTFNNGDEYTVSVWFNSGTSDNWQGLVEKSEVYGEFWSNNGFRLWVRDNATYARLNSGTSSVSTGEILTPNTWYHAVAMMDENKEISIYIDGIFRGSANVTTDLSGANNETFHIGILDTEFGDGWDYEFNGTIDEVRVSNTLRAAAWIKFEYRNIAESDNEVSFEAEVSASTIADITVSATVAETAELMVYGTTTGVSIDGATTTVVTTTSTVPLGQLSTFENSVGAQILTMSTNAGGGYTVTIKYDHKLWSSSNTSTDINDHTGTNATPTAFSSYGTEAFGYTTEDFSLSDAGEGPSRFSGGKWAGFSTDAYEVAYHTGPISATTTKIGFQAGISILTPAADDYECQVTYTMTGTF